MTQYFLDTSAVVKRYIPEIGSKWIQAITDISSGNGIIISRLTTVELVSALARRQRNTVISASDFTALRQAFLYDIADKRHSVKTYFIINLTKDVLAEAQDLIVRHPLRALDSIQLACALKASKSQQYGLFTFVTADKNLLAAATAEGLPIDDPNAHP